jgi:putative proteasome-type protease
MTYAAAVRLQRGLVFAADTRTNAGIDNISQFRKLHFLALGGMSSASRS